MATSLASLRTNLSDKLGDLRTGTTSALAGTISLVVDTALADKPDGYYEDWFVKITSGAQAGQTRLISAFTKSTGTLTVHVPFAAAIAISVTYELHRINPDDKDKAIKQVLRELYPALHKLYYNDTLITGNWLRNGNFEDWAVPTIPDNWAKTANLTCVAETGATLKQHGVSSLKATAGAATQYAYQSQIELPELLDLRGQEAVFRAKVYTATASNCRLQIYDVDEAGTATTTSSDYHPGNSRFRLLEVKRRLPQDLSTVEFRLTVDVNAAIGYFDLSRVYGPQRNELYLPASGWKDIKQVDIQMSGYGGESASGEIFDPCDDLSNSFLHAPIYDAEVVDDGTDKRLRFHRYFSKGYKIVLRGMSYLTQPASDTATTEIDEPQANLVAAEAASWLYSAMPHALPADDIARAGERANHWKGIANELRRQHGMIIKARFGAQAW